MARPALLCSFLLLTACADPPAPADGALLEDLSPPPSEDLRDEADLRAAADLAGAPLFDHARIRDKAEADCRFDRPRAVTRDGVALTVWDLSYSSLEAIGGALRPIRMRAFAARPAAPAGPLAGIVQAHGLGGLATENSATGPAALLSAFVIAYTGPATTSRRSRSGGAMTAPSCSAA